MILVASILAGTLAGWLWVTAPELPETEFLRYGSSAACFLSVALAVDWVRRLIRDRVGSLILRTPPAREDHVYVGRGFEWEAADAEQALLQDALAWDASRSQDLFLPERLLDQHLLILGTTGTGKTRMMELLILQAIARGEPVAIIDPKGDERLLDLVRVATRKAGRPFRYFSLPVPHESISYNPVGSYTQVREVADRIAATLPSAGESMAFRNYAWEVVDIVARALEKVGEPVTLPALRKYAVDRPEELSKRARTPELAELVKRPREHYQKMISALVPSLSRLAACESLRPGWSWDQGAQGEVTYFFLGSLLGYETANAVAKMALLDFQSFVGRRYLRRVTAPFSLFVDELGDVLTPEFVNILNKARGAGVRVTACAQTISDLEATLGSRARALQVLGNVSSVFQFRPQSVEDAEAFGALAGRRMLRVPCEGEVYEPALFSSGFTGVDDFRAMFSKQHQRAEHPLVPPAALLALPTFHYYSRWGGRVYRGVAPRIEHEDADRRVPAPDRGRGRRAGDVGTA